MTWKVGTRNTTSGINSYLQSMEMDQNEASSKQNLLKPLVSNYKNLYN